MSPTPSYDIDELYELIGYSLPPEVILSDLRTTPEAVVRRLQRRGDLETAKLFAPLVQSNKKDRDG